MALWLLTTGDGSDGNGWDVIGIYTTEEKAGNAKSRYQQPQYRADKSSYIRDCEIEECGEDVDQFHSEPEPAATESTV
ncbi:MAG: hypothetical protein HQ492_02545 [Woeseiaceae bacterium]|nr:hypothetical protein [Woeseiaceae bacterium]